MKKSLIALTLAALPVAAMADVTLYGHIKAGVEVSRTKDTSTEDGVTTVEKTRTATEIADFGSRIGFKGHEHLGNNLNAIWQVEQDTSIAGTDSGFGTRESFIGLEGSFGKVRAGKLNTILKDSGDNVNAWESSAANEDVLQLGNFKRVEDREISVRYDSPVFAGFSGSIQYVPRDNANSDDRYDHEVESFESYHAGLNYQNAGFFAQYAGAYAKNELLNDDNQRIWDLSNGGVVVKDYQVHRVVGGYDANNLYVSVAGQYQRFKEFDVPNTKGSQTEIAATAAYRLGNVTPRVSYAHGFKAKVDGQKVDHTGYNQVIVGADYDFSKRTSALVSAGWLKNGNGNEKAVTTAGLVGLRHKF